MNINKEGKKFIEDLIALKEYWVKEGYDKNLTLNEATDGLLFSILSYIDGEHSECKGYYLKSLDTNKNDFNKDYYLHEFFHKILLDSQPKIVNKNVFVKIGNEHYHCEKCGNNVFTKYDNETYKCNNCGQMFEGER